MKTPLVWKNLLHNKLRTATAVVGVAFPVFLVFVQLGLHDSVLKSATLMYDALRFDVVLVSTEYVAISKTGRFPRGRLYQALATPGVQDVTPLYIGYHLWRNIETRAQRDLMVIGCDPRRCPFRLAEVAEGLPALQKLDSVLIDRLTRPEYGPRDIGLVTEIGRRRVEIVGQYTLGTGFVADGAVLASDRTFSRLFTSQPIDEVSIGLVRLTPGADADTAAQALRTTLPGDVRVFTRRALQAYEQQYWAKSTDVGIIFGSGVVVGFVVQIIMLYQRLATDITQRTPE